MDSESNRTNPLTAQLNEAHIQHSPNIVLQSSYTHSMAFTVNGANLEKEPLANPVGTEDQLVRKHFDNITTTVQTTLEELDEVYNTIGYSVEEKSEKKSEIFNEIQSTIRDFADNIHREKTQIEDECEWLRKQTKVILSMINDSKGERNLSLMDRGLLFSNQNSYEEGYKQQVLADLSERQSQQNFSDFVETDSNNPFLVKQKSIGQEFETMLRNIPNLSLIQLKTKLNSIIFHVLQIFVNQFRQFNNLNLNYAELKEVIGDFISKEDNQSIISSIPSRAEAEFHKKVLDQFEEITTKLNSLSSSATKHCVDNSSIIDASPRKTSVPRKASGQIDANSSPERELLSSLRDINRHLVNIIRGLRFPKISQDLLNVLSDEINESRTEMNIRKDKVSQIICNCFAYIESLQMTDASLEEIQKKSEYSEAEQVFLDIDTLQAIGRDPVEFGLNNVHVEFLMKFENILRSLKESRQQQWDKYSKSCTELWGKLGEGDAYINDFLARNRPLTEISLLNFQMELNKLYQKRSQFIEQFISDTKNEIEKMWSIMFYSTENKQEFEFYGYDPNRDDQNKETVLAKHEEELSRLKEEYHSKKTVLDLYNELNELVKDQEFLQKSSMDSSRLLSKNSCKILLNEEKIRKKINKNFPRVIEELKNEVKRYNSQAILEEKKPMTINGEDLLQKVLRIESSQRSSGARIGKAPKTAGHTNVSKRSIQTHRSPQRVLKSPIRPRQNSRSRDASPNKKHNPPSGMRVGRAPLGRTFNNPTTIRLTNAINSSLLHNSPTLSIESPMQASKNNSLMSRIPPFDLKPLNNPLSAMSPGTGNSTILSAMDNNSPLRGYNFSTSSPVPKRAINQNQLAHGSDDKENSSPFVLSPIKINSKYLEHNVPSRRKSSVSTCDSSTLIGEDFTGWRQERIKEANES
ncbi:ASE1 [[Candida] subhashii]|uniref:ASE1 n=1 Tax=[Candida] subhashii TaxID=561895 RepID=A0A8J5UJP1_9ASCO|nr:ASE1 [[Candida] subhashii]KAG7664728.1 ASE1 [[Candida] subhashii]